MTLSSSRVNSIQYDVNIPCEKLHKYLFLLTGEKKEVKTSFDLLAALIPHSVGEAYKIESINKIDMSYLNHDPV